VAAIGASVRLCVAVLILLLEETEQRISFEEPGTDAVVECSSCQT
jgi:hypothetical protein